MGAAAVDGILLSSMDCFPSENINTQRMAPDAVSWKEFFRDPSNHLIGRTKRQSIRSSHPPLFLETPLGDGNRMLSANRDERWDRRSLHRDVIFGTLLDDCAKEKDLRKGISIHAEIDKMGMLENIHVGCALMNMYAKSGALEKAKEVFDQLPVRSMHSWHVIIAGYAQHGFLEEALTCFRNMRSEGISSSASLFNCMLKACGRMKAIGIGAEIHSEILREGWQETNISVGNALIDMYAKSGMLTKGEEVFNELSRRDIVTWNTLITGYLLHMHAAETLKLFYQMQDEHICPDTVTFLCILKACGKLKAYDKGCETHASIVKLCLVEDENSLSNALLDMYAKCDAIEEAENVFDTLKSRDVVSWNTLITGYVQHSCNAEALNCLWRMQNQGFSPNEITFVGVLKACGNSKKLANGQQIHAIILKDGLQQNILVATALVDMYLKCAALETAREVFDGLHTRDVVLWSALITGYVQHELSWEALSCFKQMKEEGIVPNNVTIICSLKSCASLGAIRKGQEIHVEAMRRCLLRKDLLISTTLIDMYAKCGEVIKAQEIFNDLLNRDAVSWNALIAGYSQHMHSNDNALKCFEKMHSDRISADSVTCICIFKACASMGVAVKGQEVHTVIVKLGLLHNYVVLGNSLIDMYGNCGMLMEAREVFDKLLTRDIVSWNVLIAGYTQCGEDICAFYLYMQMIQEGIIPNSVTFTILLNGCSHLGLLKEAEMLFQVMILGLGIVPNLEQYTCLIDLYGRAGQFGEAVAVIKQMPFFADPAVWHVLLGACQRLGDLELGRMIFEYVVQIDWKDCSAYVCMSNIIGAQEDTHTTAALVPHNSKDLQPNNLV